MMNEIEKIVSNKVLSDLKKEFLLRLNASIILSRTLNSEKPLLFFLKWVKWCFEFLKEEDRKKFFEFVKKTKIGGNNG
ncbi:MAG: hypothetical protein QXY70_01330 [Nanopusillaceae archaeon]